MTINTITDYNFHRLVRSGNCAGSFSVSGCLANLSKARNVCTCCEYQMVGALVYPFYFFFLHLSQGWLNID